MGPVFALLLAAACSSEPTEPFREGVVLNADPTQLYLELGQSKTVQVGAVDGQGNPLTFNYEVTNPGVGISVRRDSTFLPEYLDDTTLVVPAEGERYQFVVTANAYGTTQFTVSAGGEDLPITVQVVPEDVLAATISNTAPGFGEEIVITAPAGTRFSATSIVQVAGAATQPVTVAVAPDGSTITAILPPNVNSPLTITDVTSDGAPTLVFNPQTSVPVVSPAVDSLPATVSSATPDAGSPITLTSTDPNFTFDAGTGILVGTTPGFVTSVAPDGSSLTFELAPGVTGTLNVNGVVVGGFPILLPATAGTVTAGATVPTAKAGTDDPATAPTIPTPGAGQITGVVDKADNPSYGCGDIGLPCQVYKLVIPADGDYDFQATWEGTSDVGLFLLAEDGVTQADDGSCDGLGNGAGGQPEACTQTLVAGTYYVAFTPFGPFYPVAEPNPQWLQVTVTPHVE